MISWLTRPPPRTGKQPPWRPFFLCQSLARSLAFTTTLGIGGLDCVACEYVWKTLFFVVCRLHSFRALPLSPFPNNQQTHTHSNTFPLEAPMNSCRSRGALVNATPLLLLHHQHRRARSTPPSISALSQRVHRAAPPPKSSACDVHKKKAPYSSTHNHTVIIPNLNFNN